MGLVIKWISTVSFFQECLAATEKLKQYIDGLTGQLNSVSYSVLCVFDLSVIEQRILGLKDNEPQSQLNQLRSVLKIFGLDYFSF